jgi:hypothetical protein
MSLAMYAAPFDNNIDQVNKDNDNHINKKRSAVNKTQKRYPKENSNSNLSISEKVNSVLQTIHNSTEPEGDILADFNPLPPPSSAGVENTRFREQYSQHNTQPSALPYSNSEQTDNYMSNDHVNDLMNQYTEAPGQGQGQGQNQGQNVNNINKRINPNNLPYHTLQSGNHGYTGYPQQYNEQNNAPSSNYDVMIEKLNYMINLLEEQQDERTSNVTEEVVLYSFLGIFIIFVVDSFARVGKYTR